MLRLLMPSSCESSQSDSSSATGHAPPTERSRSWYSPVRTVADRLIALLLLVSTVPIIALAAVAVRMTSRGPAFYTQIRVGLRGREFKIFKLRSMYVYCESHSGPLWSSKGDPRVTPIGRLLRRTHIDELPQLWNILRGDMSLVGPRPERPEFLAKLETTVPRYLDRLRVRPGVTGLAQVQLPPDSDVEDVRRKQAYDLYYIDAMNPWLDLRILLSTPLKICSLPHSVLSKLFGFPSEARVQSTYRTMEAPTPVESAANSASYLTGEVPAPVDVVRQVQPA
jgi:lipopolysaccharide/colanic/teichoic acid biosynthesis glycosyltransferase